MKHDPMPPVSLAELEGIPEPVTACADCGFLGVRPVHGDEGGIPGASDLMSERHCPRCGYQGLPIELPTREDYVEYLRDLSAE